MSGRAPISSRPSAPLLGLDDLRGASSITVFGEAFSVELSVWTDSGPLPAAELVTKQEEIEEFLRKTLRNGFARAYRIEKLGFDDGSIRFSVFGREVRSSWAALSGLTSAKRLGAQWVEKVHTFSEAARRDMTQPRWRRSAPIEGSAHVDVVRLSLGRGVSSTSGVIDPTQPDQVIRQRLSDLTDQERTLAFSRNLSFAVAGAFALISGTLAYLYRDPLFLVVPVGLYGLIFAAIGIAINGAKARIQEQVYEARQALDLRELLKAEEQRAYKLFQVHSLEVKRYYDQALRQRGRVFWLGVLCILAGFACAGASLYVLTRPSIDTVGEKIVVASLGAVTGILANFVAAIFLRMFTSIVGSMVDLHNRLVITHHAHFGNLLAARISDQSLRNRTLASMAIAVSTSLPAPDTDRVADGGPAERPETGT